MLRATPALAIERLTRRIESGEADFRTYHNLAIARRGNGDVDGAIASCEHALTLAAAEPVGHLLHGLLLRDADRFDDALAAFTKVEEQDPNYPRLQASRGVVRFLLDDVDGAALDLESATRLDSNDHLSVFNLAIVQIARKKFDLAFQAFERCIELEPERARLYYQYLVELGRAEVVEETLAQAHRIKNRVSLVGHRIRRLGERLADRLEGEERDEVARIEEDQSRIREDLVSFLGAIRPRPMKIEAVCPKRLMDRIIFVASASHAEVEFDRDYEDGLPLLRCDVDLVQEAILNLVLNAVDAVAQNDGDSPVVAIGLSQSQRDLIIDVRDEGPGIDPDLAETVFRFGFTTKPQGSGVGLAQARRAIQDHGGEIRLVDRQRDAKGAWFQIRLPVSGEPSSRFAHLVFRSQLLDEPQTLILEEHGEDLGL